MRHARTKIFALAALALGFTTVTAEAANCQGRRDTGTAVGAIGGGLVGNAASHGSAGGTIAGVVIGGLVGNVVGGNDCNQRYTRYVPDNGAAYYYDNDGYRRDYRRHDRPVGYFYDRDGYLHYYRS
jgi:uncharacterized protein YcfJ